MRVVDGLDRVEIIDKVDKLPVRTPEGLHFGFEFNVPDAMVRINSPMAVVEPEVDQLPGACKNWFSVERWVDVANADYGVTWATVDAPLVEMGGLTANLLRSQPNPKAYLKTIQPSPRLYSWIPRKLAWLLCQQHDAFTRHVELNSSHIARGAGTRSSCPGLQLQS